MKDKYTSLEEFKADLNREYMFRDIGIMMSWLRDGEFKGQMTRCCFHKEKTGSMQVGDHFFRCYGCGAKGDIFTFAMKKENISFYEAVYMIAEALKVNIELPNKMSLDAMTQKKNALNKEWSTYKKYFSEYVKRNTILKEQSIRFFPFDCGYDPKENRIVLAFMRGDNTLGFTKRRLDESTEPKWKHSDLRDSLTETVSQIFNIDSLKGSRPKFAYITEGPGDVASMVRAGFDRTICCCGTSNFSNKTLDRIMAENIDGLILVSDSDAPGIEARKKWCKELIKYDYLLSSSSFVMCVPEGKDPGECSADELHEADKDRIGVIKYFLKSLTKEEMKVVYNEKGFEHNPIRKQIIEAFSDIMGGIAYDEAETILTARIHRHYNTDLPENVEDYIGRLKSTAGLGDAMNKYGRLDDVTPEKARTILKLKYGIKE